MKLGMLIRLALAAATSAAAAPQHRLPDLVGTWEIVQVVVGPGDVQALVENDPSYLGTKLRISRQNWAWDRSSSREESLKDQCDDWSASKLSKSPSKLLSDYFDGPIVLSGVKFGQSASLTCAGKSAFGPDKPMPLVVMRNGRIALPWYDNGLLVLRRL